MITLTKKEKKETVELAKWMRANKIKKLAFSCGAISREVEVK